MAENKTLKTLPYFLGGVALGAAVGLLYAPKSGKETREQLGSWLKKKREATKELANKIKETLPAKKEQVVHAFRAAKETYQAEANHKKEPVHA